ncbi:MAG TPA: hypothetical protein VM578_05325 [Candidatus Saccharimonadales bacterium]|nr:hypothetical protein [Candidatus Saccharimonadales bacterium]
MRVEDLDKAGQRLLEVQSQMPPTGSALRGLAVAIPISLAAWTVMGWLLWMVVGRS